MAGTSHEGPLSGLRVLDLSGHAGQYCGKMFADLGADVVLVEQPGGSPVRRMAPFVDGAGGDDASLPFAYFNTSKLSVVVDLESDEGRARLKELARTADLLIETDTPGAMAARGLGYEDLCAINPRLVYTSISPFGQTGPYAGFKADDLVAMAMGGMLYLGGYVDGTPVTAYGHQAFGAANSFAAIASLASLLAVERDGQGEHIDVSIQESVVMGMENAAQYFDLEGAVRQRHAGSQRQAGAGVFPARDGQIYMLAGGVGGNRFWKNTIQWLVEAGVAGVEELQQDLWQDNAFLRTDDAKRRFKEIFSAFSERHTKIELYEASKRHRVPIAPIATPRDVVDNRQLRHREFFQKVWNRAAGRDILIPGPPYRFSLTPWKLGHPAPAVGEHDREVFEHSRPGTGSETPSAPPAKADAGSLARPLEGLRVADFSWIGAGSYTTKILADLGAEVIKIESAVHPDSLRLAAPFKDGKSGLNRSGYFADRNSSKYSVSLNLKDARAVEVARKLIARSDIVANNFTPGTMEKFGLGYEALASRHPGLVYLEMTMQGNSGPDRDALGYGLTIAALGGLQYLSGEPGKEPAGTGTNFPDHIPNPTHAAFAILAAVRHVRRTGQGQKIEMAQVEPLVAMLPTAMMEWTVNGRLVEPQGNRDASAAPRGVYRCKGDERWIAITVSSDEEWKALAGVLGARLVSRPGWGDSSMRAAEQDAVDAALSAAVHDRDAEQLMLDLQQAGVCAGVVKNAADLVLHDPQLVHRGHWARIPHPETGDMLYNVLPFRFANRQMRPYRSAPLLGEHTDEIVHGFLEVPLDEFEELRSEGVFR